MKLIVKELIKNFDSKEVLKGADFCFEQGKLYGLLGRNGAGKTTFFNCLNEDVRLDGGTCKIEDNRGLREIKTEDIGYVLSTPVVPEFLTAREFLKFFLDINNSRISPAYTIDEYLKMVQIEPEDRDRLLKDYSHGMKSKIQMLVNIIANPAVLLLDEPLTSFDVVAADEMKQLLRGIKKDHIIILSTHIMELALDLCDVIIILNEGMLKEITNQSFDNAIFKEKIITALKGENNA